MYLYVCMHTYVCLLVIYLPAEYIVEAHTDRRVRERKGGGQRKGKLLLL